MFRLWGSSHHQDNDPLQHEVKVMTSLKFKSFEGKMLFTLPRNLS